MSKTEAKSVAKNALMDALAAAYYQIADSDGEYTEEEKALIYVYINKFGVTMGKSIGETYYTT